MFGTPVLALEGVNGKAPLTGVRLLLFEDQVVAREQRSLMKIVGCDFHPSHQQVAIFDSETGEIQEKKLNQATGGAGGVYRELKEPVLIGMEATGNSRWFELLVLGLGHELWIGDAAEIRASYVRKQK